MKKTVLAIGIFDGVHIGHRRIISAAIREAKKRRAESVIVTFDPHPLKVLSPHISVPSIMSASHRLRLICALGADRCCVLKFDRKFSRLSPRDFAGKVLSAGFNASKVFIGSNFVFGKDNTGNAAALKELGREYGFEVKVVPMVRAGRETVSSSAIRRYIINGKLNEAARMLGRPVSIYGTVVSGKKRGRLLGYPTANIDPHHEAIPPAGVYAVRVRRGRRRYGGALFIGKPSTFGETEPVIEVHIFDFHEFIYHEDIEVEFVSRLRGVRKFRDHEALIAQIKRDDKLARKILKTG
ncbi:MAG: bifunctional riboflavin kinase/FAD synthetase [Candidatus Omnitrophica bacterium]|nr:bifunctional riboflavin kinase/FAD synthetase [Candidatus Omnitrophota bacterium]